jgi:predicted DNA-binding ribbon-helix-helix protein
MTETVMHDAVAAVETAGRVHPAHGRKNSSVIKRSVIRNGHKSSISLEDQFWDALREIADRKEMAISTLVAAIDHSRTTSNLSSAIRVFVLDHFRHHDGYRDQSHDKAEAAPPPATKPQNRA